MGLILCSKNLNQVMVKSAQESREEGGREGGTVLYEKLQSKTDALQ